VASHSDWRWNHNRVLKFQKVLTSGRYYQISVPWIHDRILENCFFFFSFARSAFNQHHAGAAAAAAAAAIIIIVVVIAQRSLVSFSYSSSDGFLLIGTRTMVVFTVQGCCACRSCYYRRRIKRTSERGREGGARKCPRSSSAPGAEPCYAAPTAMKHHI